MFYRNGKFFMQFSSFLPVLYILCSCLAGDSDGGLLSAHLHFKNIYTVNLVNDFKENDLGNEDNEQIHSDDEGPLTSLPLFSGAFYKDCGSNAQIKSLRVSSCDGRKKNVETKDDDEVASDICEVERGSNVTFSLSFVPRSNATQLKAVIHGIVDFVPIPFPCPQPDACHNSGITCPVITGKQYDYALSAFIKSSYPKMKLWIKGQLEDENGEDVICVKIHVHIV